MGGNSSYSKALGGVPMERRTHIDSGYKIANHKVVFLSADAGRKKNILNSNSSNAIYLIAHKDKEGVLKIHSVNIFDGHDLKCEINLEFDGKGKSIPFNKTDKSTHCHYWHKDPSDGLLKRKKHDKSNLFPVDSKYQTLIGKIEKFNQENRK